MVPGGIIVGVRAALLLLFAVPTAQCCDVESVCEILKHPEAHIGEEFTVEGVFERGVHAIYFVPHANCGDHISIQAVGSTPQVYQQHRSVLVAAMGKIVIHRQTPERMIGKPAEMVAFSVMHLAKPQLGPSAEVPFSVLNRDYAPEGKPKKQRRISTVDRCQAACASDDRCKAYAFRTVEPACYLYSEVFMGGTPRPRRLGLYSSGLSILPKPGFVCAFKQSSFPPPPMPIQPQK